MAHAIESMFFVGETPWHGLGNRVIEAPTTAEAIKQAGLDWSVARKPVFLADGRQAPAQATVRETDGAILGVVGPRYHVLQNAEAFSFFDPLVESKLVTLETAGALSDGKRVWIMARIAENSDARIVGDDIVRKFILLSNSHDGTCAVRVGFTPVRVVCANTLAMAHADKASALLRLKHTRGVAANLESLRDVINVANQSFDATADQFRALAARQINRKDLETYVKVVLGYGDVGNDDMSTRSINQVADVITLFEIGRGADLPGVRGTVWAAYNAVTEHLSHAVGTSADTRYASLWFGANATKNKMALDMAMRLAA